MTISVRPLLFKPHNLNGLSERLPISHYQNNYGGALRRLNAIQATFGAQDWSSAPVFEINGRKREELIAAGSVILHERHALEHNPPVLIDVCLEDDMARRSDMIPGATLHNPDALDRWTTNLPRDETIVVYCLFGFQISGNGVSELRRRGYNARALKGGISAWHAIGGATVALERSRYEV
jgi:rhodanese-related sulfurtransferase